MSFARSYLKTGFLLFAACFLFVSLANALIDPFGLFQFVSVSNINEKKPVMETRQRLSKAYITRMLKPGVVVLGNSIAEIGFDMKSHVGWQRDGHRYNLGLTGVSLTELVKYLEHTIVTGNLKSAVLVADLRFFNKLWREQPGFDASRLATESNGLGDVSTILSDLVSVLFSWDAIESSVQTVRQQKIGAHNFDLNTGHRLFIENKLNAPRQKFVNGEVMTYAPPPEFGFSYVDSKTGRTSWDDLSRILDLANRFDVSLHIVIPPVHASMLAAMSVAGFWELSEDWKRKLVRAVLEYRQKNPDAADTPIWDFSGFHRIALEPLPPVGGVRVMTWFVDNVHFSPPVGTAIIDRIFASEPDTSEFIEFGIRLNERTLDGHLVELRRGVSKYMQNNPAVVSELEEIFEVAGKSRPCGAIRCRVE
ncbi:MAG: hypothetical protein OXR84_00505 [Magnetovibrio sp.]|nr:hypothetical protein [Magnetovibrio sp.]